MFLTLLTENIILRGPLKLILNQYKLENAYGFLSNKSSERVAEGTENYWGFAVKHLDNLMTILNNEGPNYAG